MVVTSRTRAAVSLAIVVVLLTGCGTTSRPGSASPQPPPELGLDWGRAAVVDRPEEGFAVPSPGASFGNTDGANRLGHPLHFFGQAAMADVIAGPGGRLVAVGSVFPGWHPVAWTSQDANTWRIGAVDDAEFGFPVALATRGTGDLVAVGRIGLAPAAWTSPDGLEWTRRAVATLGSGGLAERMTSVVATTNGFLAGGSAGPELGDRHARFWTSADGSAWTPAPDDASGFADAEVRAIVAAGGGFVAVGTVGNVQDVSGSIAWTSTDGVHWTRIESDAFASGRVNAVVGGPFGGLVAVGSDLATHEALAWTSPDGRLWTRVPGEASRQFKGTIVMTDVVAIGDSIVGVGKTQPLQRSTAASWVSRDGVHWEKGRTAAIEEQAEIAAATVGGPGIVAVGAFGGPDDVIPIVFLSPAR